MRWGENPGALRTRTDLQERREPDGLSRAGGAPLLAGTARTRWGAIGGCRAGRSEPVRVTAVERSMSDGLLEQGFEMWPSCARMINEGKLREARL